MSHDPQPSLAYKWRTYLFRVCSLELICQVYQIFNNIFFFKTNLFRLGV